MTSLSSAPVRGKGENLAPAHTLNQGKKVSAHLKTLGYAWKSERTKSLQTNREKKWRTRLVLSDY